MLDAIKSIQESFSEMQMSEFAWERGSTGYSNIHSFITKRYPELTDYRINLIQKVFKADCEIYGW